jgi:hypothetical protein
MAHSISVKIPKAVELENSDVVVLVKVDGEKLGTLSMSRGSIDWLPKGKKAGKQHEASMNWSDFAALMEGKKKK